MMQVSFLSRMFRTVSVLIVTGIGFLLIVATGDSGSSSSGGGSTPPSGNNPPAVSILSPADKTVLSEGDRITFTARATDVEDGTLAGAALRWDSSKDGYIGFGTSLASVELNKTGSHTITLTAEDRNQNSTSTAITLSVNPRNNAQPTATINAPADASTFSSGDLITFSGSATDPEDGNITGNDLVWTSSKDKQIGTGNTVKTDRLSDGKHTITLIAMDSEEIPSTPAAITIEIKNTAPIATISYPADGYSAKQGEEIYFAGKATDPEDGDLSGNQLMWRSDKDGNLGTGKTFNKNNLSVGTHKITLIATDSDGEIDIKTIQVTITA